MVLLAIDPDTGAIEKLLQKKVEAPLGTLDLLVRGSGNQLRIDVVSNYASTAVENSMLHKQVLQFSQRMN